MMMEHATIRAESGDNGYYQRRLAASLIASLGRSGAIHACQANAWDGVLRCILRLRDQPVRL
jgi:hypothetical protein